MPDGVRIYYEVLGDAPAAGGPPVVLLQGLGLSSRFWFDLPAGLARADEAPTRVLLVDNRGCGRSDRPRGPYRMATLADDVARVLDAEGVGEAIVAGISFGGMVAQHVALRHPERVRGLVLLATTPGLPHGDLPRLAALASLLALPFRRPGAGPSPALARLLVPPGRLGEAAALFAEWPAALAAEPQDARSFFAQLAAIALHSTGSRLHRVRCPAVVMTGDRDVLVPPRNSEVLASLLPRAALEVLPGVGHGLPMLDRGAVARALRRVRSMA
jgi:pimeloyl-ACP methyl ester carboxylesterase